MTWVVLRQLGVIAALALVVVILWIDIATGLWQEYVILSGLAAGIVTFVLTALIVDRVVSRSTHERWAPVTRLAMSDILHALADDDLSEVAHGRIVPRRLPTVEAGSPAYVRARIDEVRDACIAERKRLAAALSSWSTFLASSADATDVLDHTAEIAERLDLVRDASVDADLDSSPACVANLNREVGLFNDAVHALVAELQTQIEATNKISRLTVYRTRLEERHAPASPRLDE